MAYTSFLTTLIEDVRLAIDDPTVGAKFSSAMIVRWAGQAMRRVSQDLERMASKPLVLAFDFTVPAGTVVYQLPPSIGTIIEIGSWDADLGRWSWTLFCPSRMGPFRPSCFLSGRRLVFDKPPDADTALRIEYKPSGDFLAHEGKRVFAAALLTSTQFALVEPASETAGVLNGVIDDRQNAYVGATIRFWNPAGAPALVQERTVLAHVVSSTAGKTRLLTLDSAPDPALTQDGIVNYQYELLPVAAEPLRQCVVLGTAMLLCSMAGLDTKKNSLALEYRLATRTERLSAAHGDLRRQKFQKDTFFGIRRG